MYTVTPLRFMKNCTYVLGSCERAPEAAPGEQGVGSWSNGVKEAFYLLFSTRRQFAA